MGIFDDVRNKLFSDNSGGTRELHEVSDQPKDDIELCGYVKNYFEEVRSQAARVAHEGIWMTNIAYLLGFDSVYYDPSTRQFRPVNNSRKYVARNRIHSNLLLPAAQNRLARMLKSPPKYDTRPNSMEEEDKESAQLGLEVIGMVWDKQAINRKRIDLGMWTQQCGHSYIKVSNDDSVGEPLVDPMTGQFLGYAGETRVDVVSAFEGFPDPLAKTFEECQKFGQAKVRKLDYFRTHYPERGHLVKPEGAWLLSAQYEMRINSLNSTGPSSSGTAEQMQNAAIELNYYERPSKKHPKGRHVIVANGVLLKNDELPYGEIPFAKFDDVVVGGKFYSESLITHARPLQDQYNKVLEKRRQWTNRLLAGKFIAAKGHALSDESINDQSGEVWQYDPVPGAAEPHAVQPPQLPEYAYKETEFLKDDLYEIMGLSEISRGQLPSASIPAIGMQILLEQDETRIGIEVEQHEHSWARVGQLILKCENKFAVRERKLKTKGKNLQYQVKTYTGDKLTNHDVIVIRGSTTPNVKVIERQEIMNAFNGGLLGNPQDPAVREKVLGMLEYGDVGEIWEDQRVDMDQIQRTIQEIENEIIPLVNKLDNHPLHILIKNRYRKGDKFDRLSDKAKQILETDIENHVKAIASIVNPDVAEAPDDGEDPAVELEKLMNDPMADEALAQETEELAQQEQMAQQAQMPTQEEMPQ